MSIRVRRSDGEVRTLEEIFEYRSLKDNQLSVQKNGYLRAAINLRKNYMTWKAGETGILISFSGEKTNNGNCCKLFSNRRYFSKGLSEMLGEGIFELKKLNENMYEVSYPKK